MSEHGEVSDAIKDVDAEAAHTTAHADRVATPDEEQTADAQSGALTDSVREHEKDMMETGANVKDRKSVV